MLMAPADDSGLDRLLPRHELPNALAVRWNTARRPRSWRDRTAAGADGLVRDVSLSGALIEVDEESPLEVGEEVEVMLGQNRGTVVVRHVTPADGTHGVLYGVEYGDGDSALKQQFEIVVAHLRGDDGTLGRVWRNAT